MNPGLVVKLRPTGPWRIGPDSGARNKVDAVYHSDSLYGAVTSAMARLGSLEEWLDATARSAAPAVCFSSCFPFVDEIGFVTPPRTVWPPTAPGTLTARVRWKSARFVPLGIVQAILSGERLDDSAWAVDGASGCLLPAGRPGPFRMGVRGNAAVDRLSGAAERHSTACLEFRAGAGLWTIVSFADDSARERWSAKVQAAFRWLADSGFGGERSRGWGRSEAPEFIEGTLPEMILRAPRPKVETPAPAPVEAAVEEPPAPPVGEPSAEEPPEEEPPVETPVEEPPAEEPPAPPVEEPPAEKPPAQPPASEQEAPRAETPEPEPLEEASQREKPDIAGFSAAADDDLPEGEANIAILEEPPVEAPAIEPVAVEPPTETATLPQVVHQGPRHAYWLLSLYTPAAGDTIDWTRGNYSLVERGGRVDTSGDLKKQIAMVTEGSVLHAAEAPRGSAPDVAPEGCPHPVYRAGFAVAIPLGEVG